MEQLAKSSWWWICTIYLPDHTSCRWIFCIFKCCICMFCVLLTRWKLKVSVLALSSRVNCIINSQAVKRQGMVGIHTWAFTFSQAQLSIVCVFVPDKTLSIHQKCHLSEEKQVMVGRDLSLWRLDSHRTLMTNKSVYGRHAVNKALSHSSVRSISPIVTYIHVRQLLLFLLFLTFSHMSLFPPHILFLCVTPLTHRKTCCST